MKKTVIVGGGITGLATAFALKERGHTNFVLIESADRLGGKITSDLQDGFLIEGGPDSFLAQKKAVLELCSRLGLDKHLVGSNSGKSSTTYVWSENQLRPMPDGMMLMAPTMLLPFLRSRLISWTGKFRTALEMFVPKRTSGEDESLGSFVRRRLGEEVLDKIAGPLMAGIHAADPERLSLKSTFPVFLEMERKHGSLFNSIIRNAKRAPQNGQKHGPTFVSLRGGLKRLTDALVAELPENSIVSGCSVVAVYPRGEQYRVALSDGSEIIADDVVFTTPAPITADLVEPLDPFLARGLRSIRYVSTATVSLGFHRSDVPHRMQGSGFIVPHTEVRRITACSWSSEKFSHRAPGNCMLLRVFIGGARAESLAERTDEALIALAREEIRTTMDIVAKPMLARAYRWHKGIPQYEVGHEKRVLQIEQAFDAFPGLHLAGAAYHGAGVPDCIQSGNKAAEAVMTRVVEQREVHQHDLEPAVLQG